ncbi:MAG: hypothetical protein Q8R78_05875 [Candidatus Omnitrophota bacterium]|nr:hypothetical protein [Candidatus Omnitrophota bacterium]
MATRSVALRGSVSSTAIAGQAVSSGRFDVLVAALGSLLVGGVYLDGWAHLHTGLVDTFFTPWHGLLYLAYVALAAVLVGTVLRNRTAGFAGWRAIPLGYEPAVIGVAVFALGGLGDMIWHLLFGIEIDLEALLSPTHLVLALGGGLMVSGPLRAAWSRTREHRLSLRAFLPVLLSAAMILSVMTFMTQYMHPFGTTWASAIRRPDMMLGPLAGAEISTGFSLISYFAFFEQLATLSGIVAQTAILMGIVLTMFRRWTLPVGSVALIMTVNATLITVMRDRFLDTGPLPLIAVAALGGLTADLLAARLRPFTGRPAALRLYAALVPAILYTLYVVALAVDGGVWWRVHLWMGAIALAAITGWLVSYLVTPPQLPMHTQAGGGA